MVVLGGTVTVCEGGGHGTQGGPGCRGVGISGRIFCCGQ